MQKIIILSGVPASGKSTFAAKLVEEQPELINLSRDKMRANVRKMLNSSDYFPLPAKEEWAMWIEDTINPELNAGHSIIIDQTTLGESTLYKLLSAISIPMECHLIIHYFPIELEVALERNAAREGFEKVPDDIIKSMYKGAFKTLAVSTVRRLLAQANKHVAITEVVRH